MDIKKELDEVQKKIDEIKKSQEPLKKIADLQENALSLLIFPNKNVIEISWITITSGNPTFNSVFALLVITKCYDIITIYHQSSSISISCTGQGGAVL